MKLLLLLPALMMSATSGFALEVNQAMRSYAVETATKWSGNPAVVAAIKAQNVANAALTEAQILSLDSAWRAEVTQTNSPTITAIMGNPASAYLAAEIAASDGRVAEVFAMDARGLNAAASAVTSDYWQGDEDKFQQTFPLGAGTVHVSEVEFDESSQTYVVQISTVVLDPETRMPIGAMTLGINAESF